MDIYMDNLAKAFDEELENSLVSSMRFHDITHDDIKNGDGLRVVLWVAGCSHHCRECQNPITWDEKGGVPFTEWEEAEFYEYLSKDYIQGATFSGGDPFHPANRNKVSKMIHTIKTNPLFEGKDIWVYTGYDFCMENGTACFRDAAGNSFSIENLNEIDVIVDGRFNCDLRRQDIDSNKTVKWRGSSNQRVINVNKTMQNGTITLFCD